ncbi:hypothetical protein ACFFRR_009779 [Megaselia abdita]
MRLNLMLLICVGVTVSQNVTSYHGFKKYIIDHTNENIYKYMIELQMTSTNIDFWLLSKNQSIVSVSPEVQAVFEDRLGALEAPYDIEPFSDNEGVCESDSEYRRSTRQTSGFFKRFHRYSGILDYIYAIAASYPKYVKIESLGYSNEGRVIPGISISINGNHRERKIAYIQGGAHGREWICTPTILYTVSEILANIHAFRSILQNTRLYFVPLVNPDGYEYTHTVDRFWRKNRHRFPGRQCVGVDINRNFGLYWGSRGSSNNHCSEIFNGLTPFSEPETQAVRTFLEKNRSRVKLVLDVHSFGKFFFYPYGYTKASPPTKHLLHTVAQRASNAISNYRGTRYTIGSSSNLLYEASGGLDDWAYGSLGIPLSYTVELPGNGFSVPSHEILHIGRETYAGFIEFIRHVTLF